MNAKQDLEFKPVKVFQSGDFRAEVFINNIIENGRMVQQTKVSFVKMPSSEGIANDTAILKRSDLPAAIVTLGAAHDWLRRIAQDKEGVAYY